MNRLIIGRYFPGNSLIHQLDPRFKLIFVLYFIGLLFFLDGLLLQALFFILTLVIMVSTGVSLKTYVRGVRPLIWLILFATVLRIITTRGGEIYYEAGFFTLSEFGLVSGAYTFLRFVEMIFISTVLTLTTKPIDLTDAIYFLLKPLRYLYVPVEELSLMLSIALRFIPNLLDETEKVMNAQKARGMVFGEGNLLEQMKALTPLVLPLFAHSLKRAEDMADVLEVKGYKSGAKRTHYRALTWQTKDTLGVGMLVVLTTVVVMLNRFG